nr:hypothetical protein [Tanacetum cinerariifolium]
MYEPLEEKIDAISKDESEIVEQEMENEEGGISGALPCQLPPNPKELNPGSFTLPCTIGNLNLYVMADLGASVNVMPKSIFEHLKLVSLKETNMVVEMADMITKAPLGIVENILLKINKFLFSSNFVIIDMPGEPNETVIPGRPFLATIHAQIDVFKKEVSLDIGEDRIKFDMDRDTIGLAQELEGSHKNEDRGPGLEKIVSRWHMCKPVYVFYDEECGMDYEMWLTCNPDLNFCNGYDAIYRKGENGMLEQWMCFRDHERKSVGGNRMAFADFLKVGYGNKVIDDTTRKRRYNKWVAHNSKFNDN